MAVLFVSFHTQEGSLYEYAFRCAQIRAAAAAAVVAQMIPVKARKAHGARLAGSGSLVCQQQARTDQNLAQARKETGVRVGCSLRLGFKKLGCFSTRSTHAGSIKRRWQARYC